MDRKILCTLGPSSLNRETIRGLTALNVDLFRINLSHAPVEKLDEMVELIRAHSDVPICFDSQGAQLRTGSFAGDRVLIQQGDEVELVEAPALGQADRVPLYPPEAVRQLEVGDLISLDFDEVLLQVVANSPTIRAWVISSGHIGPNKACSVINHALQLPALTDTDIAAIQVLLRLDIPYFALSFASSRTDVDSVRDRVKSQTQIISKIESRMGVKNAKEIMQASDAVLIDRGDLSREVSLESVPFVQKEIIHQANELGVPVYVATNFLESMVTERRPTRPEVNDVVNTLMDGADGLVLAAETAVGNYPVQCARVIRSLMDHYQERTERNGSSFPMTMASRLIPPLGGKLIDRVMTGYDGSVALEVPQQAVDETVLLDILQIGVGAFSPLEGFMGSDTLESVLNTNRLPEGTPWPLPILLQLPVQSDTRFLPGDTVALVHQEEAVAILHVDECYTYDLHKLSVRWFGTDDLKHPGVAGLFSKSDRFLSGKIDLLDSKLGQRKAYELTPVESRAIFEQLQWQDVVGFHTRNVAHRAHEYLQLTALQDHHLDGLFIHPVVGPKKSGDFSGDIIMKTYNSSIANHYPPNKAVVAGFPTHSRYAGPREAVFTALCRQNYGCNYFIVGRDHTGVSDYYAPDAAKELFLELGDIPIQPIFFGEIYYCQKCLTYVEGCQHGQKFSQKISGTQARKWLTQGEVPPDWYMRESVTQIILEELRKGGPVFTP